MLNLGARSRSLIQLRVAKSQSEGLGRGKINTRQKWTRGMSISPEDFPLLCSPGPSVSPRSHPRESPPLPARAGDSFFNLPTLFASDNAPFPCDPLGGGSWYPRWDAKPSGRRRTCICSLRNPSVCVGGRRPGPDRFPGEGAAASSNPPLPRQSQAASEEGFWGGTGAFTPVRSESVTPQGLLEEDRGVSPPEVTGTQGGGLCSVAGQRGHASRRCLPRQFWAIGALPSSAEEPFPRHAGRVTQTDNPDP